MLKPMSQYLTREDLVGDGGTIPRGTIVFCVVSTKAAAMVRSALGLEVEGRQGWLEPRLISTLDPRSRWLR